MVSYVSNNGDDHFSENTEQVLVFLTLPLCFFLSCLILSAGQPSVVFEWAAIYSRKHGGVRKEGIAEVAEVCKSTDTMFLHYFKDPNVSNYLHMKIHVSLGTLFIIPFLHHSRGSNPRMH